MNNGGQCKICMIVYDGLDLKFIQMSQKSVDGVQ